MARIELMSWEQAQPVAGPLRFSIFVGEQNVPAGIELDDKDAECVHAVAYADDGSAIGTGRLLPDGHIVHAFGNADCVQRWQALAGFHVHGKSRRGHPPDEGFVRRPMASEALLYTLFANCRQRLLE